MDFFDFHILCLIFLCDCFAHSWLHCDCHGAYRIPRSSLHVPIDISRLASGFNSAERKRERERRRARALKMLCALARMALVSPVSGGSLRCAIEWEDRPAPASQLTGKAQGRACLLTAVVSNLNVRNGRVIYFWNRTPTPFSGRIQMTLTRVMTPSVGESWLFTISKFLTCLLTISSLFMAFFANCIRKKLNLSWIFEGLFNWLLTRVLRWRLLTPTLFSRTSLTSQESRVMTPESSIP